MARKRGKKGGKWLKIGTKKKGVGNYFLLLLSVLISLFLGLNISSESNNEKSSIEGEEKYRVIYISDGDTISVKRELNGILEGELIKIRMYGIDAPEKTQDYGMESKEALSNKIKDKLVEVEVKSKDRYGRTVGIIWLDNRNINEEMIRDGQAWYYEEYDKNNENSRIYQENAIKNKLGLFSRKNIEKPWEYRKKDRDNLEKERSGKRGNKK